MADLRVLDEEYTALGQALIDEDPALEDIRASGVSVAFLRSELEKKTRTSLIYGQCERVPDKYRWAVPFDFMVTVFEPNVERFTEDQLKILLLHELLHIGVEEDGNEYDFYVREHDIEDFNEIIDRYGVGWSAETYPAGEAEGT